MKIITGDWWEGVADEAFMAWLNVPGRHLIVWPIEGYDNPPTR